MQSITLIVRENEIYRLASKTKRPKLLRVVGRSLNSPPPKSAHKQPNDSGSNREWLGQATVQKRSMSAIACGC
jgi:hypothetical protein